jgi:hypothetical protein
MWTMGCETPKREAGAMPTDLHIERCVECGKFMNCEEIDARNHFEPDSHFGPEVSVWTCGPCVRRERNDDDA